MKARSWLTLLLAAAGSGIVAPAAPTNPILYCTQVPVTGFVVRTSAFGTHDGSLESSPRGGDLMIRYPDGSVRNLTQEAGYGVAGLQGPGAIAVREPAVHWSGTKAVFSMVVGGPDRQYRYETYFWQLYEVTGLAQGQTVQITRVPNQPEEYNNISPVYGSDDRIIFTSDRPHNGEAHLYPQRDEYESAPTVTGIWSLDPDTGDLRLLTHTPSGAFNPIVDSFGRVIFTRWDHLQQDQQADVDRAGGNSYGSFTYASEAEDAARLALGPEVFPEPRLNNHPENLARNRAGHRFNLFMPWQVNQDGTEEETVNHVGRHEFARTYHLPSFLADDNLSDQVNQSLFVNRTFIRGADGGLFFIREDPNQPGTYWGIEAPEFNTNSAGQILRFTGAPSVQPEQMVMTAITDPVTANGRADDTPETPAHVGLFRSPLPLTSGDLVAAHSGDSRSDRNDGTRAAPVYRHQFRLRLMTPGSPYHTPGAFLTAGTSKSVTWWDPDVLVSYSGPLWELDPVEVVARPVPPMSTGHLAAPEQQVLAEEGVSESALRAWLAERQLALIVTRNNTVRDRSDVSQPFNLRVPGGVSTTPADGTVYDVAHLQIVQGDLVRGYGGTEDPQPGRRVLGQFMHDPAAENPANPAGPEGSVRLGLDGSSAAFVPAQRALSWQLTDETGEPVVRERNWVTFQPGEIRTCAACHGVNSQAHGSLDSPTNKPEALRELLRHWKTLQGEAAPPAAPTHVAATTSGTDRVHLSWRGGSETATGYRIERGATATGPFSVIATLSGGAFHFTDDDPPAGTAAFYRVTAVNEHGDSTPVVSAGVTAGVAAETRLLNISTRALAGEGEETLIAGFAISGGGQRRLLVRAVGPELETHGVTGVIADPRLEILDSNGLPLAANDDWSGSDIAELAAAAGAFPLTVGSADAAALLELGAGSYTVHAQPATGGPGVALLEVYDVSEAEAEARLVNISTRGRVGTDAGIMIPGFVVSESQPRLVLVRGVGPSLAEHGVTGALGDPQISIYSGNTLIARSADWETATNAAEIAAETERVGAFALVAGSADDALLITLPPGSYTVHVDGVGGTTGIALCEVYSIE